MITWVFIYGFIKFWLPLASLGGLIVAGYRHAIRSVSTWVASYFTKHLDDLQSTIDKAGLAIAEAVKYNKEVLTTQLELIATINEIKDTFREYNATITQNQAILLASTEVIKSKQDLILTHVDKQDTLLQNIESKCSHKEI